MPIYEYICGSCRRVSSFFIRASSDERNLCCTHCGGQELQRILSRFASLRSEEDRLESLADPQNWGSVDETDPKSVARFVQKMGGEMGEDIDKSELEKMADEAARGTAADGSEPPNLSVED
ncbi:zinc ribbon domain-containing protein [candidate division KSB1 bacterium]|nr:zinc ribbon domain-containing protein [candidate division KSB1 bacterium]